jgi:hypothetical protein
MINRTLEVNNIDKPGVELKINDISGVELKIDFICSEFAFNCDVMIE